MPRNILRAALAFCLASLSPALMAVAQPNFVVILVDDAALMDFGGYGGEARTPNIDRLGAAGVRFANYHTSPLCAPSRAMLLTGLDSHRTGVGTIPEVITREQRGQPGYELALLPEVETVAEALKGAGYETYMTGKWHLGQSENDLPNSHGFDRSFALDASGADNWEQKPFMPLYEYAPWFEDGKPADLPEDFYSSRFLIDKMIEYIGQREDEQPFFAYVAFQAIHIPVQAPREFTDRYDGVYGAGWDALRTQRFETAKALGLIPQTAKAPPPHPDLRDWASLSDEERAHYERVMMVNAGMLEAMDFHIGRLIDHLDQQGVLEDTVFVITSDNGPEFNDPIHDRFFQRWMRSNGYHIDLDRLGERGSMGAIGTEWASAAAGPNALFKMYASEGGTRVPLIMSGPGIDASTAGDGFHQARTFVTDIAPTILDIAGVPSGQEHDGRSLRPLLNGSEQEVYHREDPVGLEVAGNSALFKGRFKLTRNTRPHGDAAWRLYDIANDPGEVTDLSEARPQLLQELQADYARYADTFNIVALSSDFDIQAQIGKNARAKLFRRHLPGFLLWLVGGLLVAYGLYRLIRARLRRQRS